ncbi:MAG TPA: FtsX-like permease family protein [Terriglobales bacterium]|jgi:putative ABC transport system permease protein|nr:FtsX-like permease family protein [Terriglobales bacterium]
MTLTTFVTKSAFRNKRRSILTIGSLALMLTLLTFLMTIWRAFYIDNGSEQSTQRLITRHKVSLTFSLPIYYEQKMKTVPGVAAVVPTQWFGGRYIDDKPEHFFAQFATDPQEFFTVYTDFKIPADQLDAWQHDRAGVVVDNGLAKKFGWKVGDRIVLQGTIWAADLTLTIRGIYTPPQPTQSVYFDRKYLEEAVSVMKDQSGTFGILADSPADVPKVAATIDDMFHNSPQPTKTESEKAFGLDFVAMLGNVKAFILSICGAVVFTGLLVSANTMAMSIRERTREVAVLKTLGFTRKTVLSLFVCEGMVVAVIGGAFGLLFGYGLVYMMGHSPQMGFFQGLTVNWATMVAALALAATVGLVAALVPSYNASKVNIVEGLRYIG